MGFGGNQKVKTTGMDTIGNSYISINNVRLVDGLKHNLLSISQFFYSGYEVMNEYDKSILFKGMRK